MTAPPADNDVTRPCTPIAGADRAKRVDSAHGAGDQRNSPEAVGAVATATMELGPSAARQLATITDLVARVSSSANPTEACQALANELAAHIPDSRVLIGLSRKAKARCRLMTDSQHRVADPMAESSRLAEAVFEESIARSEPGRWPPAESDNRHALLAHKQLSAYLQTPTVLSSPLRDSTGALQGVCVLVGDPTEEDRRLISAAQEPLASALGLQLRADGNQVDRCLARITDQMRKRRSTLLLASATAVFLLLLCPFRYQVRCNCELQPVVRRFVAAPMDGRLESSFHQPGDFVEAGDMLARLDGRDILWDLSGKRAEVHRAETERDGYLAAHESGQVELSMLEIDRLQLDMTQLEDHANHLEIRSPIAGMVVLGDLSKSEGIPLEKGQTLFEIAPLERMVIEIFVPEDDVRFVEPGMPTAIRLDAFPMQTEIGTIARIHPRAELKDQQNVFVAEVAIDNTHRKLRPGMRGRVRIATARRSLGWIIFHKAYSAGIRWLGW